MAPHYIDLTYTDKRLKNLPHRMRLKSIFRVIDSEGLSKKERLSYADIGCSNGFVTNLIAGYINPSIVVGFGHGLEMLKRGGKKYSHIKFSYLELNEPSNVGKFDFVSCLETLEHVGNLDSAIDNLINTTKSGGTLIITVPIEVGFIGTVKFLLKTLFYNYNLTELPGHKLYFRYLKTMLSNGDISKFRDNREGWGTHFGFDYRLVDKKLSELNVEFRSFTRATTRFYIVKP
jgi:SAM-dependent methyltransferase